MVDGMPRTIVGILPNHSAAIFRNGMGDPIELWLPLSFPEKERVDRGQGVVGIYGKLKPNVSVEQAREEMIKLAADAEREFPVANKYISARVESMQAARTRGVRRTLTLLLAAVAMFLLLACANVANLLLARGAARQKEIAIRLALGATPARVAAQVIAECLLLAAVGSVIGILLGYWGVDLLQTLLEPSLPPYVTLKLDSRALLFAIVVSAASAILFGIGPAFVASRTAPAGCLKSQGAASTHTRSAALLRNGLVGMTIAIAVTLVVCSGLMVRSIYFLTTHDRGLNPNGVASIRIQLGPGNYPDGHAIRTYYRKALARLAAVPGVDDVGVVSFLPVHSMFVGSEIDIEGRNLDRESGWVGSAYKIITPNYYDMLEIPLLSGRKFDDSDSAQSQPVAIISRQTADSFFPDENPIGQRVKLIMSDVEYPWSALGKTQWRTIVGVVGHVSKYGIADSPDAEPLNEIYIPLAQKQGRLMHVLVRARHDTTRVAYEARVALGDVDADQPVGVAELMTTLVADEFAQHRNLLSLIIVFSVASLALAAVGIFGVMSHWVTQQRRELGIRMALGAGSSRILGLVLLRGFWITLIGSVAGVVAARVTSRVLSSRLYGVTLNDPLTYVAVVGFVFLLTMLACFIPAKRATQINAWTVLKDDI